MQQSVTFDPMRTIHIKGITYEIGKFGSQIVLMSETQDVTFKDAWNEVRHELIQKGIDPYIDNVWENLDEWLEENFDKGEINVN